jgi:hypothetical protein
MAPPLKLAHFQKANLGLLARLSRYFEKPLANNTLRIEFSGKFNPLFGISRPRHFLRHPPIALVRYLDAYG